VKREGDMKVLILLPNPPTPYNPSFARAYYLIKFNRSYDIKVLALCRYECEIPSEISSNYKIKLIKIPKLSSSNTVNGLNSVISRFTARNLSLSKDWNIFDRIYFPSMQDNILNLCAVENFDVIYAHRSLCSYLYILRKKIPVILDFPSPQLYALTSLYQHEDSITKKIFIMLECISFRQDAKTWREFSAGIFVSRRSMILSKPFIPQKVFIIPPGIDTDYYKPSLSPSSSPSLVFVGSMNYYVNAYSILYFCRRVYPLIKKIVPSVKFYIVGRDPPNKIRNLSRSDSSIIVTGRVEDVRPYICKAHAAVVPIIIDDGGIKTKTLEAMAMGKAVISTSIGAEGIGVTHGENIIISDEPEDFAEQVINVIQDDGLRRVLGYNARRFVERNYSWERATNLLEKALEETANARA
jgi:glycosyltransferase involved in cell wall biosynthesis